MLKKIIYSLWSIGGISIDFSFVTYFDDQTAFYADDEIVYYFDNI